MRLADSALAESGVSGGAARGDDDRRYVLLVEIEGMIEASAQDRGRSTGIFRGSEDDDRIGAMHFFKRRRADDPNGSNDKEKHDGQRDDTQQTNPPAEV